MISGHSNLLIYRNQDGSYSGTNYERAQLFVGNEPSYYVQIKGFSILYVNLRSVNVSPPVDPSGVHQLLAPVLQNTSTTPPFC